MKFEFETGEVIEVFDDGIAKLLRVDKRYKEVVAKKGTTSKGKESPELGIQGNLFSSP